MADSPTIVVGSLNDDELKQSITSLVNHVKTATQDITNVFDKTIDGMKSKLDELGNHKVSFGGSSSGGTSRMTKEQNDLTKSIERTTDKAKELNLTLDQGAQTIQKKVFGDGLKGDFNQNELQVLINRLRELQALYYRINTEEGGGIKAENLKNEIQSLGVVVAKYQEILRNIEYVNARQGTLDIRKWVQDMTAVDPRLKQLKDWYSEQAASQDKATSAKEKAAVESQKEIGRRSIEIEQLRAYYQELEKTSAAEHKLNSRRLKESLSGALSLPTNNLEEIRAKIVRINEALKNIRAYEKDNGIKLLSEANVNRANTAVASLTNKLSQMAQKRLDDLEKERQAQQKAITQYQNSILRSEFAKVMRMPSDGINEVRSKLERLRTILANIRELGILSPSQIASAETEINKLTSNLKEQERIARRIVDDERRITSEREKEISQAEVLKERVASLAQSAREYFRENKGYTLSMVAYGKNLNIYGEDDKRAQGLSIEEQISRQLQQQEETMKKQIDDAENLDKVRKRYLAPKTDFSNIGVADRIVRGMADRDGGVGSIEAMEKRLKSLQETYRKFTETERNTPIGKSMAYQIQWLGREIRRVQAQMSRPINLKAALGGSEKTIDDIAEKMRRLSSYRSGLNVDTQKNEIRQVNSEYERLKNKMDEVLQKNQSMLASNNALGRSWNYMKNRLAFYFTVGASTQFVKSLIEIRGQYELLDRSIGILIDSAQNGSQIFAELNAMAIKSPFTTMELGAAAKQLVAYDVAAKDVVDTTRRLADMAAAVGIPIERLTYALGQIKAYGYLNARDARMFANAGIPLVKELADYYTELEGRLVSTADVYDRIKKKAIDYSDVMNVVNKMTDEGGKFFNFQEKAADTLKVRIANLTLAWNNMLNEMGKDNQGILTEGLKVTKQIFESWRDINNMVIALGLTYGTIKAAQIAYYLWVMRTEKAVGAWSKIINAIDYAFNAKTAKVINSLKTSLVGFFTNPAAILTATFTALSVALTKAYLDYRDLQAVNEEFNKSVVKNAEENVKSIDKFFEDYQKQLESVGSLNSADQTKLWERVQEEIEKTTKNAGKYIDILNKIPEISKRIEIGEEVLEQSKRIQDELKRMAERGEFNIGGGFANDSAAKDLQQYSDIVNELIRKYGTLDEAKKEALKVNEITLENGEVIKQYTGEYTEFQRAQIEAEKELQNIVSTLDKVNIAEVLGGGDMDTQLANVRSFAIAWRDAFLATEKGSKISAEGQALLNSYIDKWIEQQARVNHLIKDENTAAVEANRTAWETFFKFLNIEERKRLDVAIKTNQLGSKSVQELWDNAAERMQEKATTSYNLIQQQIADLRNTPDVVINVVYRNNKERLEDDQERFEERYIQPKNWSTLSVDEYLKQEKANREKYGTLMRKQGEDTAEYEKRISDERKKNLELSEKNGKVIEENKNKTSKYSIAVTELADKEKKAADDRLKVIKEIEKDSGYDFSTKSENAAKRKAVSELAKALKDELSTIDKVRSIYKDLTKEGMSHADAVERATRGWNETVNAINKVLQKNGLQKLDLTKFAGVSNPRELVDMLKSQLDILVKRGAKAAEIKELQAKIQTLNVDADKYDLTKITKGLNNELDKLKDEYELALELDANPELGELFEDMFGIGTSDFPKTIDEYMNRAQQEFDKMRKKRNFSAPLDIFKAGDKEWENWGRQVGLVVDVLDENGNVIDKNTDALDKLTPKFKEAQGVAKKWATDVVNNTKKLEYELAELNDKIAIKEKEQARLHEEIEKEKNAVTKHYLQLTYQSNEKTIDELRAQALSLMPEYARVFNSIAEYSAGVSRRLQRDLMRVFVNAKYDRANKKWTLTGSDGKKTILSDTQYRKEKEKLTKEMRKSQAPFKKIKEAFKPSDENGVVDYAKGIELVSGEVQKLGSVASEVGNLAQIFGADEGTVEVINDVATSLNGVATAGQGISQIASGDYIGGAASVLSGIASVIGAWADNGNKLIDAEIKDSERAVKRLELAYIDLENAVNKAYGTAAIGAQKVAIENKKLQLAELKRQLRLEQSRDAKYVDNDRIIELQKQVKELEYDISDSIDKITNDLLGISSVGDAMESLMGGFIDALRNGEDAMAVFDENIDDMIANMVKKLFTTKILQPWFEEQWNNIQRQINERANSTEIKGVPISEWIARNREALEDVKNGNKSFATFFDRQEALSGNMVEVSKARWIEQTEKMLEDAERTFADATSVTVDDIKSFAGYLETGRPLLQSWYDEIDNTIKELGLMYDTNKSLSNLQQGIQGITESTAGALEAYLNGVSQQVYLHTDILTQIRDAVVMFDADTQLGTLGQMLLQLQQSYQTQMAIQSILEGVLTPSGRAFNVELQS